jgi:outer membrane lipoprotein LolB
MDSRLRASSGSSTTVFLASVVLVLTLGGCASLRSSGPAVLAKDSTVLAPRTAASAFTASGRVAARVTGDSTRGFSGGFSWVHRPASDTIELLTPLGQIAARMNVGPGGATIEMSDGSQRTTTDPEGFLAESFGMMLPLAALPNWLQGVPLPGMPYRAAADLRGRPSTIWQNGWEIQYSDYSDDTPSANPMRLQLTQGNIEARMIISEWSAQ